MTNQEQYELNCNLAQMLNMNEKCNYTDYTRRTEKLYYNIVIHSAVYVILYDIGSISAVVKANAKQPRRSEVLDPVFIKRNSRIVTKSVQTKHILYLDQKLV